MDRISGYKDRALESLKGKWGSGAIATLLYALILYAGSTAISLPFGLDSIASTIFSNLWTILCLPLSWGLCVYFLDVARNNQTSYGQLFDGYKDFLRIFVTYFVYGLIVGFGLVLLIVPGIIFGLMFSQIGYILKDHPEMGIADTLKLSADMMKGHKMDYFLLELSFIGWAILAVCTLGLGFLLLIPYMYTTTAHYYEDLKKEYQGN